jgi:hypothetical protein
MLVVVLAASMSGCGKGPAPDATTSQPPPRAADATPGIEPVQETVTVLAPPGVPRQLARRAAGVAAERGKTEARVRDLMNGYAQKLGDARSDKQYREQLARQLGIYKQQSLELFKLQQRAAREAQAAGAARAGAN